MSDAVVYDSGALIAIADPRKQAAWEAHRRRVLSGLRIIVPAVVAAQVVRKPAIQERLMRVLRGCDVVPFSAEHHVPAGQLLATSGTADVIDAFVALMAVRSGAGIVTGDAGDLARLLSYLGARLPVLPV
jgi:predicted nucleic acid-binding protein